jgi:hypothetical protein
MNSNTALVIFAMVAMLGFATATVVIPYIHQVQAQAPPHPGKCDNKGSTHTNPAHPVPGCL